MSIEGVQQERHIEQSMQLDAEGYVELYSLRMLPPNEAPFMLYLSPTNGKTWQGKVWESFGCSLSGYAQNSSGESSRPVFMVFNPRGIFSRYVHAGWVDNAEIIRYRVLKTHYEANLNSYTKNTWRVAKVASLSKNSVGMELRSAMDGQFFILPGRAYFPPDFPHVSL